MDPVDAFRCSADSRADEEPMAGTAPADARLLLVEAPGPWGAEAITDNRLPAEVSAHLAGLVGIRPQLIRRTEQRSGRGTRVFHAAATGDGFVVTTALVPDVRDLPDVDLVDLAPYEEPLWLVCTNGRRDRCCAEVGRPIAAALGAVWPEATWETTHLGGHRFAGTLLALPSGLTLGRLDVHTAVDVCREVASGGVPLDVVRGRAGRAPGAQVRELHLLAGGDPEAEIVAVPGPARRQSCGKASEKPTTCWEIRPG